MFGEDLSESPRVPSPWDNLISTPPSPSSLPVPARALIPKLVPEAEEGNVEYKLQLLSPSPARFARLVTQMKWRLLEGGGQAYYELGVADSGMLVGLPRVELEQSLETLEEMAGEIGASVIVVKEIEVPATISGAHADHWNAKRGKVRSTSDNSNSEYDYSTTTTAGNTSMTEPETELATDVEDDQALLDSHHDKFKHLRLPIDDKPRHSLSSDLSSLSLFMMEPEPDPADNADAEETDQETGEAATQFPPLDLEISAVFKPRPTRRRREATPSQQPVVVSHTKSKRNNNNKAKKTQRHEGGGGLYTHTTYTQAEHATNNINATTASKPVKHNRRATRDRRREERRQALLVYAASSTTQDANVDVELVSGLASLHVPLEPSSVPAATLTASSSSSVIPTEITQIPEIQLSAPYDPGPSTTAQVDSFQANGPEDGEENDDGDDTDVFASPFTPAGLRADSSSSSSTQRVDGKGNVDGLKVGTATRLIVEVLVVRKMSLDEVFLDFGGFSLI